MCGIAGYLDFNAPRRQPLDNLIARLEAMRDSMAHRGPDGKGHWISADGRVGLAHRRLAIVDLSEAAGQPMANEDGGVRVTFNGEIYNHMALRRELERDGHRFRTGHADTEVIVHGYEEWGAQGLTGRLDGMFALAIWDAGRNLLTLARDRIGIKPVYFTQIPGSFLFASEIKALLTDRRVCRDVETAALNHYLSFLVAPAPLTMFKDIFKLPAGHLLEVDSNGRMSARRYWDAVPGRGIEAAEVADLNDAKRERFYTDGIRKRLEAAIGKRMMADVPFGVFLSGGIDSSANVALMSRLMDRPVETFTVGFKDHPHLNELEYARRVAGEFKTHHHEVLIDEGDMTGYLDDLVHHQDEPIADWVCIPLYFVSKLAKESGVTVVQVGEGSDEQFCGYSSYMTFLRLYRTFWRPYLRFAPGPLRQAAAAAAEGLARWLPAFERYAEVLGRAARNQELFWSGANAFWNVHKKRLMSKKIQGGEWPVLADAGLDIAGAAAADSAAVINSFMAPFDRRHPGRDDLTRMIHAEFRLRLPELLLMRVDKIAMSASVEGRVPFLDHNLVEFTMDIPGNWKVKGGTSKYLLKKALEGLLPADIIDRPKMGFGAPMADWLRGPFGHQAESTVLKSDLLRRDIFDRRYIAALFRDHRQGRRDHALHLWTLFNLAAWHDHWIAGASVG
ncbi:MAG TPA: asparagine synthase (glutamine-hydrolyzing) [Rhodospirillaceae bacterium]|jgi:asparagine synthase (glutamine-hydrolysing)|nr:asparagine synthase (glutamine-hydrolyzing) [Rhodospirillales bacterium]HIJ44594.1 asparagine synthase (glutamine-hydrolyzing) [Rhodospirillaceae bacterium]HIJ92182.1 asparagine synthase (glutamine-hydrolyzing) [Rhodospirillaceae bacterium]HJP53259.1 asparagine synthase (glutamine-hydrolyzing) [Rhodospirillales bacterium]